MPSSSSSDGENGLCLLEESVVTQPWTVAASRTARRVRVTGKEAPGEAITA